MAVDKSQTQDVDLDRTDRLPVLAGAEFDDDVEDDAVRLDYSPAVPSLKNDFPRSSAVDLPSLAESVRSVEERIARQSADFEALSRSFEKARDAEAATASRAQTLSSDLAEVRALLESEQARSRELDQAWADKSAAIDAAQMRLEDTIREAERNQSEARALGDTVAAREATLAQATHSLGERDLQLSALQREHAKIVPMLEERSQIGAQLDVDLRAERERSAGIAVALRDTQQTVAALAVRVKAGDSELSSTRYELQSIKSQAATYLETLRSREWRRGFDQNLFRELDAQIGAAQSGQDALQAERDQLRRRVAEIQSQVATKDEAIAKLQSASAEDDKARARHAAELRQVEASRAELSGKFRALEVGHAQLQAVIEARDARITLLQTAATESLALLDAHGEKLAHAEDSRVEMLRQIDTLEVARSRLTEEMTAREEVVAKLNAGAAADAATRAKNELLLQQLERVCADLTTQIATHDQERGRLHGELAARDQAVADAQDTAKTDAQRSQEHVAASEKARGELAAQIEQLQAVIKQREDESAVLLAHLQEARRPLEPIKAETKRLTEELAAKAANLAQVTEDNRSLRAALERAKGALEEREFLIRRLERSESNNANVLGRIQTSIERLGTSTANPASSVTPVEGIAELLRVDGKHNTSYALARRTRIGRAPGCEMQIESSSVSRHHALLLLNSRDIIIEDLNSTNGVLVNGRKVTRQGLNDGDLVTIGDAQFRLILKPASRTVESPRAEPQ